MSSKVKQLKKENKELRQVIQAIYDDMSLRARLGVIKHTTKEQELQLDHTVQMSNGVWRRVCSVVNREEK